MCHKILLTPVVSLTKTLVLFLDVRSCVIHRHLEHCIVSVVLPSLCCHQNFYGAIKNSKKKKKIKWHQTKFLSDSKHRGQQSAPGPQKAPWGHRKHYEPQFIFY